MKKSIKLAAVTAVAALTLGSAAGAIADDRGEGMGPRGPKGGMHMDGPRDGGAGVAAVLAELVKAGTITQAQSDAISKALINAPAAAKAAREAEKAAHEKLIADTVGVAWTDIETRLKAGETLAAIAGAKKDALIAALVKEATDRIDAAVAAGRLTTEKAAIEKTGLTERITAMVASPRKAPQQMGPQGKGPQGKGPQGKRGPKGKVVAPKTTTTPSATTGATNAKSKGKAVVKQVKTVTTKKSA